MPFLAGTLARSRVLVAELMEFANDPGPYPFATVRERDKWGPRVEGAEFLEVTGIHGCPLPHTWTRIVRVEPYTGPVPRGVPYKASTPLIAITLDRNPKREACCGAQSGAVLCWDCPRG